MTDRHDFNSQKDFLDLKLIDDHLGRVSDLPEVIVDRIRIVCSRFLTSYLGLLRLQKKKPEKWLPESVQIDWDLVDDMRHCFSDYQHITQSFFNLSQNVKIFRKKMSHSSDDQVHRLIRQFLEYTP